jgi:hypothetical protein
MFLGRAYRKKRALLLLQVPAKPKALSRQMSWSRPLHNAVALERNWYQGVIHTHAACCGCGNPGAHFAALVERYNSNTMQQQRLLSPTSNLTPPNNIRRARALPAAPDHPPALPWHGDGGRDGDAAGSDGGGPVADYADDGLDGLIAALDDEQ